MVNSSGYSCRIQIFFFFYLKSLFRNQKFYKFKFHRKTINKWKSQTSVSVHALRQYLQVVSIHYLQSLMSQNV